jgi:hypothetical protein
MMNYRGPNTRSGRGHYNNRNNRPHPGRGPNKASKCLTTTASNMIIPLVNKTKYGDEHKVTIRHTHTSNLGVTTKYITKCFLYEGDPDNELLLLTIEEFMDACAPARLNLTTGPQRFAKFRECLGGPARTSFDTIRTTAAITCPGFDTAIRDWVCTVVKPTAIARERQYLESKG